jgi:hypothetical protein
MNIERINSLAGLDFTNFIQSENNVKYKIVIPFLQSFNHLDLDLEHAVKGVELTLILETELLLKLKL